MASIVKTGSAKWEGSLKEGKGHVSTQSGVLSDQPYGFNTRFEGKEGTNPEELIGAAHASCFSMALSMILGQSDLTPDSIETKAEVHLEEKDGGFHVPKVHLSREDSQRELPDLQAADRRDHDGRKTRLIA